MSSFAAYAKYYDLLYRDKDYSSEADYVAEKLRRFGTEVRSILEIGCGTGAHAALLAERGFTIHGVDISEGMLTAAEKRRASVDAGIAMALSFSIGDARSVRLERKFDAVISLFHVFSYQTSNEDLRSAFATAKAHLRPGGLLFFDCWYGPSVLTIGPSTTVKRLEDDNASVTRIAEPTIDVNANTVDVSYDVIVMEKQNGMVHRLSELHRMRYLFTPEIVELCAASGLEILGAWEWMGDRPPNPSTWAACFAARG